MSKQVFFAAVAVLALLLFGCIQQPAAPSPTPAATASVAVQQPGVAHVRIAGDAFSPQYLTVARGTTVVWTNEDSKPHSIVLPQIDSGPINPGQSFNYSFNEEGVFDYVCGIHSYASESARVTVVS